jgi:hypothetical protein
VVVNCGCDVERWTPIDVQRHQLLSCEVPCRPCSYAECPYERDGAWGISADEVIAAWQRCVDMESDHA